jgi:hypothetical protein
VYSPDWDHCHKCFNTRNLAPLDKKDRLLEDLKAALAAFADKDASDLVRSLVVSKILIPLGSHSRSVWWLIRVFN